MTLEELLELLKALPPSAHSASVFVIWEDDGVELELDNVVYDQGRVILS